MLIFPADGIGGDRKETVEQSDRGRRGEGGEAVKNYVNIIVQ